MNITIIKNKDISDYKNWGIWECVPSRFDWTYNDEEHCFIIKGKIVISYENQKVNISPGRYLIAPNITFFLVFLIFINVLIKFLTETCLQLPISI